MAANENVLERSVGALMGVTYRKMTNVLQARLKDYEITTEQWSVLFQVDQTDGLIQKEIAELAGKDKATTTRILDHLEEKGLISRKMSESDRRSFQVSSTDKGALLLKETLPIEKQVNQEIKQCMTDDEHELLMELLLRINHHVNKLT
ncbi:MarR family winged helix-turn-helix transcriptional regulator [Paenibacillus nasutitermitis]|uniref:Transcriptional regulator SlyA n=1 Tax=Paenibacillus nasutitermitis TaxID=1652958 RepID=A0A916YRH6_9BACL|nr:MarR family transcriptional regulator [Paenibacillus nasutitermitis]GGD57940.1 transcriptional regulator SlyA [Paenibacillus nasutitermitis]